MYADLRDLFTELPHRDDVRAAILTGTGRGFCAGGDVHEIIGALLKQGPPRTLEFTRMTGAVVQRMRELPVPDHRGRERRRRRRRRGARAGGRLPAAGAVGARSSSCSRKVGLAGADMGAAYLLPRVIGLGRATELLMLGHRTDADEACTIGLANTVVEDDRLMDEARELAGQLAYGPAAAYASTKVLLHARTGHRPGQRDRAGGRRAGAADAERGPRGVLPGVHATSARRNGPAGERRTAPPDGEPDARRLHPAAVRTG